LSPLLNLSDADVQGFEALDSGTYPAEVFEVIDKETKGGENAKLPKGTPMMNVQFRLFPDDSEHAYHNRRVFNQFVIPPEKVNGKKYEHRAMMLGQIVRFLVAIGYTEEEVMSDNFETDYEDMKGRPCKVTVGKREYPAGSGEFVNDVKGVKPPSGDEGTGLL
jgi:Protein of unknown function (DUF669)